MTSKTSYNNSIPYGKYIIENIRQRGWLSAVAFLSLFLLQPVYLTLNMENFLSTSGIEYISSYQEQFPYLLNGFQFRGVAFAILFLAVACGVSGFAYLHQPRNVDLFHGFPLKRTQWFLISYTGGLLIFLVPFLFSSICTLIIAGIKGVLVSSNLLPCILAVLGSILGFLVLYHTSILAMMLTGKLIAGTLAAFTLIVYGSMVAWLSSSLVSTFRDTCYYAGRAASSQALLHYISPLNLYEMLVRRTASASLSLPAFFLAAVFLAALLILACFLYQKRALESAGNALAYPRTASVIKILIAVPTALFTGIFVNSFYYNNNTRWVIFCSIFAVFLLCGIIEFIYTQDFRQLGNRKWSSLVSILGVIGILAVMQWDLFGYDTWLPEKEEVESMAVYSDTFPEYFSYPEEIYNYENGPYILNADTAQIKDFDCIYTLAEEGILNHNLQINSNVIYKDGMQDYTGIAIRFNKTDGNSTYRAYAVRRTSLLNCLDTLCQKKDYRKTLFPVFHMKSSEIETISLDDILGTTALNLTPDQKDTLFQAYQKDVLQTDIHKLQEDAPIGSFTFQRKQVSGAASDVKSYPTLIPDLYLYDTYENTLRLLEEYGYTVRTEIKPDDVIQMTYISSPSTDKKTLAGDVVSPSAEPEIRTPVTAPEEIARLLKRIRYTTAGITGEKALTSEAVEFSLRDGISSKYYRLFPE